MNAALVLTALFNGAWQGAVLCTLAVLAFRLFRRLNATTMFTVWTVLLAIAVALPFANYAFAAKPVTVTVQAPVRASVATTPRLRSAPLAGARGRSIPHDDSGAAASLPARVASFDVRQTAVDTLGLVSRYALWILAALGIVAFGRLAWLGRDIGRMLAARARVRPIDAPVEFSDDIARPYAFAASDDFTSPCVLGFAPALIVIPEELLAQPGTELTSVVLHEREHVRRFDDVQNVLQRFIGAIAFFCPGVRIALRELALYREQICDDAAVNATGDRVSYAMTLTDLAQWAQGRGAPVPSLIFKRKHLLHRLEVLLDSAVNHSLRMNRRFSIASATAVLVAAAIVLRVQVPVIAETIAKPPAPKAAPVAPKIVPRIAHVAPAIVPKMIVPKPRPIAKAVKAALAAPKAPRVTAKLALPAIVVPRLAPPAPRTALEIKARVEAIAPVAHAAALARVARAAAVAPVARAAALAAVARASAIAPIAPTIAAMGGSGDLLDALNAAGMRNLPVEQLISLRDHGVSAALVQSATSYFGRISADDLTYLADHGVGTPYLDALRGDGVTGISVKDAVRLMDHGVTPMFMRSAFGYFRPRPSADDLVQLVDHGVTTRCIAAFRENGLNVSVHDMVRLEDNGVEAPYAAKIRHSNPNASVDDIIRLHNAGF